MLYDPLALDDETRHLLELRNILEHRRRLYEQQKAALGLHMPPEVAIGLAVTERELDVVEARLRLPEIGVEVQEAVPDGAALSTEWRVRQIERDMRRLLGGLLEDIATQRQDTAIWRKSQDAWRTRQDAWRSEQDSWRSEQDAARRRGQRRTQRFVAALIIAQILGLLLIVWIAATLRAHGL